MNMKYLNHDCATCFFLSTPPKVPRIENLYRNRRTTHLRTLALGVEVLATGVAEGAGLVLQLVFSNSGFIFCMLKIHFLKSGFLSDGREFFTWRACSHTMRSRLLPRQRCSLQHPASSTCSALQILPGLSQLQSISPGG